MASASSSQRDPNVSGNFSADHGGGFGREGNCSALLALVAVVMVVDIATEGMAILDLVWIVSVLEMVEATIFLPIATVILQIFDQ